MFFHVAAFNEEPVLKDQRSKKGGLTAPCRSAT